LLGAWCLLRPSSTSTQVGATKRVLIFYELGASSPGVRIIDQEIHTALEKSPYRIEFYTEYLEATLFPDSASQQRIRESYIRKYRDLKPDLIIVGGPSSIKFMVESHKRSFGDTPIIFCGSTEQMADYPKLDSDFTGAWETEEPAKTLEVALKLQPRTEHVVVVGGTGAYERHSEAVVRESLRKYESGLEITYLTDLEMPVLLERLKRLPNHTIILNAGIEQDAAGRHFINASQAVPMLIRAANAPLFVMADSDVGSGAVGGSVFSFTRDGRIAGGIALRVLNGERPQGIPIIKTSNAEMFDWRALQRWGLRESDLPAGSDVLYREPTIWERYKWIALGTLFLILALAVLSGYLLFERRQRRRAEEQRRRTEEERLQLSGRLINAQERERSRLARELHDDFNQRLAALAVGLEAAEKVVSEPRAKQQLRELFGSASEIGADLHTLSHRLHSATLENLGLVAGLDSLCGEFGAQQHFEIDFTHENIPRHVPADVALCLFRVVQEGLRNVKKHSGAREAKVRLTRVDGQLHLSVLDGGAGFDQDRWTNKEGLGIRSMEERLRLLAGQFEIYSEAGKGTRVDAWVPFPAMRHAAARENGVPKATRGDKHGKPSTGY
jgi:signal transduction histidine kinase